MKAITALLLFLLCLMLTSCYPGTKVEIVNNTGYNLVVISMDTVLNETAYTVGSNQIVRIKVPYKLRIRRDGETWNYDLPSRPLPQKFHKRIRGNWYLDKFQIERNGAIYVLLPESQGLVTNFPTQPTGYPVRAQ